jgi:hypothetical protein
MPIAGMIGSGRYPWWDGCIEGNVATDSAIHVDQVLLAYPELPCDKLDVLESQSLPQ